MQELFYEESARLRDVGSAKTKYYLFKIFSILSYVMFVIWLIVFIYFFEFKGNFILPLILAIVPMILFIASGIVLGRLKDRFYVDYDYTIVSGTVRFSKVIKNIKRRSIVTFESSAIERIGKYGSETYEKYILMPNVKRMILTSNATADEGKDFYYLTVNHEGEKKVYILECSETFIVNLLKFTKRMILDESFKK